jgi:trehalose 6-phosphate synthase
MRGRDAAWVGWAGEPGPAPEPFRDEGLYLHPVSLSPVEIEEYYEGFANDTLWPIYHDVIVPATFHRNWWNTYRTINLRFAQAISEVAAPGATVWIHDYQLQRLADLSRPSDIAERLPKVLIHRNVPGEPVHAYLAALDDAWARQARRRHTG